MVYFTSVDKAQILEIPRIPDERGNLSFIQNMDQIPFAIKRVYWINNLPGKDYSHSYASAKQSEAIIALSGSFDVIINDGKNERRFSLNRPDICLFIPEMTWWSVVNFATNSVAFVVAEKLDCDNEYIEDFNEYKKMKQYAEEV